MNDSPQTICAVLDATARAHGDRPAMRAKRDGSWQTTTWSEYRDQARRVARGLMTLGTRPGQGVAVMGFNRPEWFLSDIGAVLAGAVPAGIYTTNTPELCRYIAHHAEATVAVVENQTYLEVFRSIRGDLPHLEALVVMDGEGDPSDGVLSWSELLDRGDEAPEAELEARIEPQRADDCCTLIYTSGTTGPPKAVKLSHRNIIWIARRLVETFKLAPGDAMFSYLPLSHIAEQVVSLHSPMATGACSWFAESLDALRDNLLEAHPDFFFGVPRVWEKLQAGIEAAAAQAPPLRRRIAAWARDLGLRGGYADQRGERRPLLYPLARRLVFDKVRARLGLDRARILATSAAPISRDTLEFFLSLGVPLMEVYGMSECTGPTTFSTPDRYRTGSAGWAIPGTELRTAGDGEILMRGPHVFLGYLKDDEATAEALDADGWLHSGDIGELDPDGYLWVTDRKKELLITSGGKNIAPQVLEGKLRDLPAVSQAVVVGDRRNYVAALLTLDPDRLPVETRAAGSPASTPEQAATCPAFRRYLEDQVEALNGDLARYESIKRFTVLPRELSVDGGELTPTMKLKRRVVYEKYAAEIEALYAEA
jgi:long-subunit acyl-CoA synthetase (AMP-forming)